MTSDADPSGETVGGLAWRVDGSIPSVDFMVLMSTQAQRHGADRVRLRDPAV
jgi:hypothetical protein